MLFTVAGMFMLTRCAAFVNAPSAIEVTLSPQDFGGNCKFRLVACPYVAYRAGAVTVADVCRPSAATDPPEFVVVPCVP